MRNCPADNRMVATIRRSTGYWPVPRRPVKKSSNVILAFRHSTRWSALVSAFICLASSWSPCTHDSIWLRVSMCATFARSASRSWWTDATSQARRSSLNRPASRWSIRIHRWKTTICSPVCPTPAAIEVTAAHEVPPLNRSDRASNRSAPPRSINTLPTIKPQSP